MPNRNQSVKKLLKTQRGSLCSFPYGIFLLPFSVQKLLWPSLEIVFNETYILFFFFFLQETTRVKLLKEGSTRDFLVVQWFKFCISTAVDLENPMDRGAWWAAVHEITKSQTRLSDFTFTFHFHALEKEMATHSRVLAWRIPGTGEPGGLPSMGLHWVGLDWRDLAAAAAGELKASLVAHW